MNGWMDEWMNVLSGSARLHKTVPGGGGGKEVVVDAQEIPITMSYKIAQVDHCRARNYWPIFLTIGPQFGPFSTQTLSNTYV